MGGACAKRACIFHTFVLLEMQGPVKSNDEIMKEQEAQMMAKYGGMKPKKKGLLAQNKVRPSQASQMPSGQGRGPFVSITCIVKRAGWAAHCRNCAEPVQARPISESQRLCCAEGREHVSIMPNR